MEKTILQTHSAQQTQEVGSQIAEKMKNGGIVLLFGDLGSGKTTFTQGMAKALGIQHHIISPTFIMMRTYELPSNEGGKFFHIDLYRTQSEKDMENLGLFEVFDNPKNIVVVEWAEKLGRLSPSPRTELHFTYKDESIREIEEKLYD